MLPHRGAVISIPESTFPRKEAHDVIYSVMTTPHWETTIFLVILLPEPLQVVPNQ